MNIVSFSGGKDSTAMLLMMIERGVSIDRIINIDTTKEFPQMYEHIEKVQQMIEPLKIETIKIDFNYWFSTYILTKGKNVGKAGYGWPSSMFRWCTGLKIEAFRSTVAGYLYDPRKRGQRNISYIDDKNIYIGYAVDEKTRCKLNQNEKYPLVEWGITEKQALEYCYSKGLNWGGLYEKFHRLSCWCCPLSRIGELRILFNDFPELWKELEEMDRKSFRRFRSNYSVKDLSEKFVAENLCNHS